MKPPRKNGVANSGSPASRKGWEAAHQLGQRDLALEAVEACTRQ